MHLFKSSVQNYHTLLEELTLSKTTTKYFWSSVMDPNCLEVCTDKLSLKKVKSFLIMIPGILLVL